MAYTALYRKFRPGEFEEVKGQEHIVTALRNQIRTGRIGHAYLFTGTRGTGKTTVAKIMAKAVNCEHPADGSPCNECASCRAISAGNSMNVIELDAASNNGVDDIRQIVEEVRYSPTQGKFRVYIIDEVHMLSTGAFNALLKTLEEPPSYVMFILATTEVHKIPITILSRCQRYDFRRITRDTITARLKELSDREGIEAEEKALRYVAKAADGSMRDALSLYDQCIALYFGQKLTYDMVLHVLGAVDIDLFHRLLDDILREDITGIVELLEEVMVAGRELSQMIVDFTWYLRNLLLLQTSEQAEELIDVSAENMETLKEMGRRLSPETTMRYIRMLSGLSNQMKYATQKRVLAEITFVKLCRPQMDTVKGLENLQARLDALEMKMENAQQLQALMSSGVLNGNLESMGMAGSMEAMETQGSGAASCQRKTALPDAVPEELMEAAGQWRAVLNQLKGALKSMMGNARPSVGSDNQMLLVFQDKTSEGFVNTEEHLQEVEAAIEAIIQKKVRVSTKLVADSEHSNSDFPDLRQLDFKKLGINAEIEYID